MKLAVCPSPLDKWGQSKCSGTPCGCQVVTHQMNVDGPLNTTTEEKREHLMQRFVPEVVSIAEACLGGLRDRSALLIGPEELRHPYKLLLQQAGVKCIYQQETHLHLPAILPY